MSKESRPPINPNALGVAGRLMYESLVAEKLTKEELETWGYALFFKRDFNAISDHEASVTARIQKALLRSLKTALVGYWDTVETADTERAAANAKEEKPEASETPVAETPVEVVTEATEATEDKKVG